MTFGERLKQIREERDMSQEELANLLGTSKQVISRYETEQRVPKITVVKIYADKLGVNMYTLLGWDFGIDNNKPSEDSPAKQLLKSMLTNQPSECDLLFSSLSPDNQKEALNYMKYLKGNESSES